jgi:hypothetical protein
MGENNMIEELEEQDPQRVLDGRTYPSKCAAEGERSFVV